MDYNRATGKYYQNPMMYLRVAQHWQVHIHRINSPDANQVILQRNSLIMLTLATATDLTAKIQDIWNGQGSLDYIPASSDCWATVTIYSKTALQPNTIFNINLGELYIGWGDLISIGAQ